VCCKELEYAKNVGYHGIKNFFYRIDMATKYHDHPCYLYNSYVDTPVFFNDPLKGLAQLTIEIRMPDGELYEFDDADHSYVLEITTYEEYPEGTNIGKR